MKSLGVATQGLAGGVVAEKAPALKTPAVAGGNESFAKMVRAAGVPVVDDVPGEREAAVASEPTARVNVVAPAVKVELPKGAAPAVAVSLPEPTEVDVVAGNVTAVRADGVALSANDTKPAVKKKTGSGEECEAQTSAAEPLPAAGAQAEAAVVVPVAAPNDAAMKPLPSQAVAGGGSKRLDVKPTAQAAAMQAVQVQPAAPSKHPVPSGCVEEKVTSDGKPAVSVEGDVVSQSIAQAPVRSEGNVGGGVAPGIAASSGTQAVAVSVETSVVKTHAPAAMPVVQDFVAQPVVHAVMATKPGTLEVQVAGLVEGPVNVRAQMTDDGVMTTLRGSAPVAAALHSQAENLSTYLADQSIPVRGVTVEVVRAAASEESGAGVGAGSGGADEQRQPSAAQQTNRRVQRGDEEGWSFLTEDGDAASVSGNEVAMTGGWLSVRV